MLFIKETVDCLEQLRKIETYLHSPLIDVPVELLVEKIESLEFDEDGNASDN